MNNPRDHGLGEAGTPIGAPVASAMKSEIACPNCGCLQVMHVEVTVVDAFLKGGYGLARYLGCPACPWAGPSVATATRPRNPTDG